MLNDIMLDLGKDQFNETALDVNNIKQIIESHLTSNSLEDEISEFFREIAALKGKSVDETLLEMITGTRRYLEAVNTSIEFKNDVPTDVNKFADKLEKISFAIEYCWDVFSPESRQFFIDLAQNFCIASFKFQGWKGFLLRLQLLWPSIQQKKIISKIQKFFFTDTKSCQFF